ncbi:hypothetical protein MLD38_033937 [Melastoma candidum]|uniref:Uncharacterized protein n=1 Tax=Melastoma candidum TaxID=119954 RepID=A0ACB9M812_9MYRT|nr:hypothetical protein MLD38_033937 [Melastoma candidum]
MLLKPTDSKNPTTSASSAAADHPPPRSFQIDLNQIPLDSPSPTAQTRQAFSSPLTCASCGRPGGKGEVVVCDGCERTFHLSCAGLEDDQRVSVGDEWVCKECTARGVGTGRWPLGFMNRKGSGASQKRRKRGFDMNASPPSDGDSEGSNVVVLGLRCSDRFLQVRHNGLGHENAAGILRRQPHMGCRSFEVDLGFPLANLRSTSNASSKLSTQEPSEVLLQTLREHISCMHGVLGEGWRVEFRQSLSGCGSHIVYCAPGGRKFDSVSEVASYLGLEPTHGLSGPNDEESPLWGRSSLSRKRKSSRCSSSNELPFKKFGLVQIREPQSDHPETEVGSNGKSIIDRREPDPGDNAEFPVQFEDFFLLSVGMIDTRASYHDLKQVWPIGYKACWHDKVTSSLFFCEVADGGDGGPIFKIRRCSCSVAPVPNGVTVLFGRFLNPCSPDEVETIDDMVSSADNGMDTNMEVMFSEPAPPTDADVFSCLDSGANDDANVAGGLSQTDLNSVSHGTGATAVDGYDLQDEIGEIFAEDCSSSLAWKKISQKFVDAFSEICKKKGSCKLLCKHVKEEVYLEDWIMINRNHQFDSAQMLKFSSSPFLAGIKLDESVDLSVDVLMTWLGHDRFGLDAEFVEEIIEHLPGIEGCTKYECLQNRGNYLELPTVGNGSLIVKRKDGAYIRDASLVNLFRKCKNNAITEDNERCPPPGTVVCAQIPNHLVADCYQVCEVLGRFDNILDLKEALSPKKLEDELMNSFAEGNDVTALLTSFCGETLTEVHSSLLGFLIGDLQSKIAPLVDPNFDATESKPRKGRKKDIDTLHTAKRSKLSMLPINKLSWPELARRYIRALIIMDGNSDSGEVISNDCDKLFRCLRGDGGVACGSLTGIMGMEADAILLAEASRQVFGSLNKDHRFLTVELEESIGSGAFDKRDATDGSLPEWAQVLLPVKKLPTNVGTRIRKCINDSLEKGPPEWARKVLEHSISKEVYKGNASGPTKKAVLSVLADVCGEQIQKKPDQKIRTRTAVAVSDIIMKQCRVVLRRAAATDDAKVFCDFLSRRLLTSSGSDDEKLLGSPAILSRPVDFRTIDLRLEFGAYGGSHEAFYEDLQELRSNVFSAFGDKIDVMEAADKLFKSFESLYEEQVIALVDKLSQNAKLDSLSEESKKEVDDCLASFSDLPKAPWDEGLCKVCGIDRDDDSVLLCDTCDSEYHIYCLDPPLSRIPDGNWYCPSCVVGRDMEQGAVIYKHQGRRFHGEFNRDYLETLSSLASTMEENEYWDYTLEAKVFLLKFLCDELLNSALARHHLEQCPDLCAEAQQKVRSLSAEWKSLKAREDFMNARAEELGSAVGNKVGNMTTKEGLPAHEHVERVCKSDNSREMHPMEDQKKPTADSSEQSSLADRCNVKDETTDQLSGREHQHDELSIPGSDCKLSESSLPGNSCQSCEKSIRAVESVASDSLAEVNKSDEKFSPSGNEGDGTSPPVITDQVEKCRPVDNGSNACVAQASGHVRESPAPSADRSSSKDELSALKDSINNLESQILKLSLRRELLGCDSVGRLYWAVVMPGTAPEIIVDGSLASQQRRKMIGNNSVWHVNRRFAAGSADDPMSSEGSKARCPFMQKYNYVATEMQMWFSYKGEDEIDKLVRWLKDSDGRERALKDAILYWWRVRLQGHQHHKDLTDEKTAIMDCKNPVHCLDTKALSLLEKKFGPCFEVADDDFPKKRGKKNRSYGDEKMCRCSCLELILSSRYHCSFCHTTFASDVDLEGHNDGTCKLGLSAHDRGKEVTDPKGKGSVGSVSIEKNGSFDLNSSLIRFQSEGLTCPFDLQEISSKFITNDNNKALVRDIGLISTNGIPVFLSSRPSFLDDSDLSLLSNARRSTGGIDSYKVTCSGEDIIFGFKSPDRLNRRNGGEKPKFQSNGKLRPPGYVEEHDKREALGNRAVAAGDGQVCVVPRSSLRVLGGKDSAILRQLKINLLDMEAALSEEALRPSKASLERRIAWRSFLKSARTIYEMVQATIIFEDMIKTKYLRNEWWYWSSLTAAVRTSTLSSLALRIYTLDSMIIYGGLPILVDSAEQSNPEKLVDDTLLSASDSAERLKGSRKSSRKRKEPEG